MKMEFLIGGFILSLVFNCLWIIAIIGSEMKTVKKWLISIALIIFCTFIFTYMFNLEDKQWNNGKCVSCGTNYQAIGYCKGSTRYECPNCHYAFSK